MKRYLAHYTFIYPGTLLKNHIVETDEAGRLACWYEYEKEIPQTEFHPGLQVFIPHHLIGTVVFGDMVKLDSRLKSFDEEDVLIRGFLV